MQQTAKGAGCGGNHLDHATSKPQPAPHGSQDPILLVSPDATGLRWASTSGRCCNASERYPGAHTPRGEVEVVFAQCSLPGNTTSCQSVCTRYVATPPGIVLPRPPSTQSIHHTAPHHTTSSMFPRRTKVAASCGHEGIQHRSIGSEPSSTLYQHTRRPARGIARAVVTQRT
jgi:hypothetical protein